MAQGYKVRIDDGSEIGPMTLQAVKDWYVQGLIGPENAVLKPGGNRWVPLREAIDLHGLNHPTAKPAPRASSGALAVPRSAGVPRPADGPRPPAIPAAPAWRDRGRRQRDGRPLLWLALVGIVAGGAGTGYWLYVRPHPAVPPQAAAVLPPADPGRLTLERAVLRAVQEAPYLSHAAAEAIMRRSQAEILDPIETFRRAQALVKRGLQALDAAEKRELGTLTSSLFGYLSGRDRARLDAYLERVRARRATTPDEDREMAALMKGASLRLAAARRERLAALYEKAIQAGLAGT